MELHVEQLVSPEALTALRSAGLHKVAAAMAGVDELDLNTAVRLIGEKAYTRRKEAAEIANGLGALAAINNEKVAWMPVIEKAIVPGLAGATIAALPRMLSSGPVNPDDVMSDALTGLVAGGALGGIGALNRAGQESPQAFKDLMDAVRRTRGVL
jgi:hypothetical protein